MEKLSYNVRFITPAFLGNAEQRGQWRTPPFKALLRQWWRVVKANELIEKGAHAGNVHSAIRDAEGRLFGHAWLKHQGGQWSSKSHVSMRLSAWSVGRNINRTLTKNKLQPVKHPEVKRQVDPLLYLGYGHLGNDNKAGAVLNNPPAVGAGESAEWMLAGDLEDIRVAMHLISFLGTIGGRSSNGWGSLILSGSGLPDTVDDFFVPADRSARHTVRVCSRDWKDCLVLDWRHAVGKDENGLLIWRTEEFSSWDDAMRRLAGVKIAYRTVFHFKGAGPHKGLCDRHALSYPVTKHTGPWGKNNRSANQMIFKVHRLANGKFAGIVFHMPHGTPSVLRPSFPLEDQVRIWTEVHRILREGRTIKLSDGNNMNFPPLTRLP